MTIATTNPSGLDAASSGFCSPIMRSSGCLYTAIDLFSGAGGLSIGFEQVGFRMLAANDFDAWAAATFQANHPHTRFLPGPIGNIVADDFLHAAGLMEAELDVLIGGPPCQAFSVYNHQRGMHDERSGLFREYLRIVAGIMPRYVVMENVTGMISIDDGRAPSEIMDSLRKLGYYVEARILKAEEYGVPQERRRILFIGSRDERYIHWPQPSHTVTHDLITLSQGLKRAVTVREALSDLPHLSNGQGAEEMPYTTGPQSEYQAFLRTGSESVYNHVAPQLAPINLERMKYIRPGGSWRDLPYSLLPTGMKLARRSDHTKRYGRLHPEGLSSTILTRCDPHWGAFIHPSQDRAISVREAARLQSFPDKFRFLGSKGDQYKQVGNAVPPLLARAIAKAVVSMMGVNQERQIISAP